MCFNRTFCHFVWSQHSTTSNTFFQYVKSEAEIETREYDPHLIAISFMCKGFVSNASYSDEHAVYKTNCVQNKSQAPNSTGSENSYVVR